VKDKMSKIKSILRLKIFIFDFALLCLALGLAIYILFLNIFLNINFGEVEKNEEVTFYRQISYLVDIKKIKTSYIILEKKFKKLFNFIEEKKDLIRYLPLKTLVYVPKKIKDSKVTKDEKRSNKKIKRIVRKKLKILIYLRSIIHNPKNPQLSFVDISISNNKYNLEKEKYYLKENACIYIKRKKLNFCIDKIYSDYVKAKVYVDNGDQIWTLDLYPGKKFIYLEY